MSTVMQMFDPNILLNMLTQLTVFAAVALLILLPFRRRAAWRYSIAYSSIVGLGFMMLVSLIMQSQNRLLFVMPLNLQSISAINSLTIYPKLAKNVEFEIAEPQLGALDLPLQSGLDDSRNSNQLDFSARSLFAIWAAGLTLWLSFAVLGLTRLALAGVKLQALKKRSRVLEPGQRTRLNKLLQNLTPSITADAILVSREVNSPAQIGFFTLQLLIPEKLAEQLLKKQRSQELEAVLVHELAHWQRRDNIANLLQKIVLCMLWFHPLVHLLDRIASQSREEICDNFVLARHNAVDYSETLFWIQSLYNEANKRTLSERNALAIGILGSKWNLEQRIKELIDTRREKTMQLSNLATYCIRLTFVGLGLFMATCVITPVIETAQALEPQSTQTTTDTQNSQTQMRTPPPARDSETLSEPVFAAVAEIQQYLMPASSGGDPDPEAAKEMLDALYAEHYESGNSFEKSTILNFYTNYYLLKNDYPEALKIFEQLLTIDELREDIRMRALRSLGQLYAVQEQWQQSIDAYLQWLVLSGEGDRVAYNGLSYAYFKQDNWQEALDYWQRYLELQDSELLDRNDYAYLNGLYFKLGYFEDALELTKEMILLFNEQKDWDNLLAIHEQLGSSASSAELNADSGDAPNVNVPEPEIVFASVIPTDGDYLPLLAVAPMYPRVAADEGIEGWILVSFTVDMLGDVDESTIRVEDAEPADVFDNAAIRATRQFKFQPRMIAGEAQPVPGVQYLFRFKLRNEDV